MMAPMVWHRAVAGCVGLALVATLSGCSWHLETEPEAFRTPTALTVLRDHVAAAESAVEAAAPSSRDPLAVVEANAVPVRLAALGGVSPTSSPRPSGSLAVALEGAESAAAACMDAAGEDPIGGLCASVLLSHLAIDAEAQRNDWEMTAYLPEPPTLPPADSEVSADVLAQLALAHDRLRALYEVVAARSEGDSRKAALEASSAERQRVADLLAIEGVEDLTEPAYDVPADATALRDQNVAIAETYAALMVSAAPQDRVWLLNSALKAYRSALANGLAAAQIPALPGAVQPSPSPSAS